MQMLTTFKFTVTEIQLDWNLSGSEAACDGDPIYAVTNSVDNWLKLDVWIQRVSTDPVFRVETSFAGYEMSNLADLFRREFLDRERTAVLLKQKM